MEDLAIIDLYWKRDEDAIAQTDKKYGAYCRTIAFNILSSHDDSDETANETYFNAWRSMPDDRPNLLKSYLGKIARNIAINRYNAKTAQKRGGGEAELVLHELEELCGTRGDELTDCTELTALINAYLKALSREKRTIFVLRYFYCASITYIARRTALSESAVKQTLFRCREQLKKELYEGGFAL